MPDKRSKYDTDPLDPDFERRATSVFGADVRQTEGHLPVAQVGSEAPTRPMNERFAAPYQSVLAQQTAQSVEPPLETRPLTAHTAPTAAGYVPSKPTNRTLPGVSLPENIALILPYIPFFIGAIAAVIELLMLPRRESRARFHAAQGLALHLAVMVAGLAFRIAGGFASVVFGGAGIVRLISFLFWLATTILFIVSMIRVAKGEPHVITPLTDATNWLDEHIEKKKFS